VAARVVVFVDYQNAYSRAREFFHRSLSPSSSGQIDPLKLAELLVTRSPFDRELRQVRIYRGRPDANRDPTGYAANLRQCAAWDRSSPKVAVITRTLRYPRNWPTEPAQEKGIDVALALDVVTMAIKQEYDVGIVMSTDTDVKPALEAVVALDGDPYPRCEVAAWSSRASHSRRLSIRGVKLWCHWLDEDDYSIVADSTSYAR